ncbi:MAG: hypothetical protein NC393_10330 [Clostridium sp.]|nr:hypothetical protein [Clostridium sp.]MCM1207499.1 hypothetical protein [Ruminococcus sp.]
MKIKKVAVSLVLALALCLNLSSSFNVSAATNENQQTLQQYKLAIVSRLSTIEGNLNNKLSNQIGLLYDLRNLSEYMMYWQVISRYAEDLGFSDKEVVYYGQRIVAYVDLFNGKYDGKSDYNGVTSSSTEDKYKSLTLAFGDENATLDSRYNNLMSYCTQALSNTIPSYYSSVLASLDNDKPSGDEDKAQYLREHSQVLEQLYKCIIVFQDVPITLTNITPIQVGSSTHPTYSVDGSGNNNSLKQKITAIVEAHEELLQYGRKVSQKTSDESLDVNTDETPIEMFTNIELDGNGEYVFPSEVELSQTYLAMLATSSVYTPFKSYVGSPEFTNALMSLADNDTQGNALVKAYNSVKDYRKPLYKREIDSNGATTGPAKLITIEEFIEDIENGSNGALVTVQGDFHYNSEVQAWIYSQNELTYDYSIGTQFKEQETDDNKSDTKTPASEPDNSTRLDLGDSVTVNASELPVYNEVDLSDNKTMIKTLENIIFVGDSRCNGLQSAVITQGVSIAELNSNNVYFVDKDGAGYAWLKNTAEITINSILQANPGVKFTIVINLGVNDLGHSKEYYEELNRLATDEWSSSNVVVQSVGAVDDQKAADTGSSASNSLIVSFNSTMEAGLSQDIQFVDTTKDMLNSDASGLQSGYASTDGIHYTSNTYLKILRELLPKIVDTNQQSGSQTAEGLSPVTTESTDDNTEDSKNDKQDTELVADDLDSAIYAYDTITDVNYLTQPVMFYGIGYSRDRDNMTTAIMKNVIANTANLSAIKNKDSRYLYVNVFGDIVTDDNLVVLPGSSNPIIYRSGVSYNPYTVAFMNAYPNVMNRGSYFRVASESDIGKYVFLSENVNEDVRDATIKCSLVVDSNNIEDTKLLSSMPLEPVFYTNTTDSNKILSGRRSIFRSFASWTQSGIYSYNVVQKTSNPIVNEMLIFPYNSSEDTDFIIAGVIARNMYEYFSYSRTDYTYDNVLNLNDNYLTHVFIISGSFGNKNPIAYTNDKALEYKQFVSTKGEQLKEQLVNFSNDMVESVATTSGTIGMDSSFEDPILGRVLRILRENFAMLAVLVFLVLLVAFMKYHRDFMELLVTSGVVLGILAVFVWILPVYLPMVYNFLLDKTSTITAYKVLALTTDEERASKNLSINIDSNGNYKYNTASLTLYKVSVNELSDFYDNLNIEAKDVTAGKTSVINQESGLFVEGDSLKVNVDILFNTLPITGRYVTVNGGYSWQLSAMKSVSNNMDYYTPYYYFVDNFINKLNLLAQVYELPRSTITWVEGENPDNYLVYSYVNSPVFLTPGNYGVTEPEDAEEYMEDYQAFLAESDELKAVLTAVFGDNTDWLGIAPVFTDLSEEDKGTLWALTMQDNGYYDENWVPNEDKINDLIYYVNTQTKDFVFDMEDLIGTISDETMIKIISLRALTAFNQRVSQFKHWLYPFSIDYAEIELGDLLNAVFVDNYSKYVVNERNMAEYVADKHSWFVLIVFDVLVILMFLITNVIKIMVPVLYLLFGVILFIRFISLGNLKTPIKGYLKVSGSLFMVYTIFNLSFWLFASMDGSVWSIVLAVLVASVSLYVVLQTVFAVFMNVLDFGDREISAKITNLGDKFRFGDLFNNLKFNTVNLTHQKQNNAVPYRHNSSKDSRYSIDASVDSIYSDRNFQ